MPSLKRTRGSFASSSSPAQPYSAGSQQPSSRFSSNRPATVQGSELKNVDIPLTAAPVFPAPIDPTTGAIMDLGTVLRIVQGTASNQRDGRMIIVRGLEVKGWIQQAGSLVTGESSANVRLSIILDTQANNNTAPPTIVNGAGTTGIFAGTDTTALALPNLFNAKRYIFLSDKCYQMNPTTTNAAGTLQTDSIAIINEDLNLDIPVEFSDAAGVVASLATNNIFLVATCSSATASATINLTVRTDYIG